MSNWKGDPDMSVKNTRSLTPLRPDRLHAMRRQLAEMEVESTREWAWVQEAARQQLPDRVGDVCFRDVVYLLWRPHDGEVPLAWIYSLRDLYGAVMEENPWLTQNSITGQLQRSGAVALAKVLCSQVRLKRRTRAR